MTNKEALETINRLGLGSRGYPTLEEAIDVAKNALKENDELFYKLVGVMHFVDKFLEGDELELDEVQRADLMREKVLKALEDKK